MNLQNKKKKKIMRDVATRYSQRRRPEPLTSSSPDLELALAEEKLPMTLSRQEVTRIVKEEHKYDYLEKLIMMLIND